MPKVSTRQRTTTVVVELTIEEARELLVAIAGQSGEGLRRLRQTLSSVFAEIEKEAV